MRIFVFAAFLALSAQASAQDFSTKEGCMAELQPALKQAGFVDTLIALAEEAAATAPPDYLEQSRAVLVAARNKHQATADYADALFDLCAAFPRGQD